MHSTEAPRIVETVAAMLDAPESALLVSILDLARRVLAVTGSRSEVRLVPYSEAYAPGFEDMRRRVTDNTRAHALVGFVPRTPLDEVIRRVAAGLRSDAEARRELAVAANLEGVH